MEVSPRARLCTPGTSRRRCSRSEAEEQRGSVAEVPSAGQICAGARPGWDPPERSSGMELSSFLSPPNSFPESLPANNSPTRSVISAEISSALALNARGFRGDLGQIFTTTAVLCMCVCSKHRRDQAQMALQLSKGQQEGSAPPADVLTAGWGDHLHLPAELLRSGERSAALPEGPRLLGLWVLLPKAGMR